MMKRRQFLFTSFLGFSAFPFHSMVRQQGMTGRFDPAKTSKVKQALLTMQRASWEQGVAAQSFLESGDEDITILMAHESVLRQNSEGQLSVQYHENGVTDPAAAGEAVLYAWGKTGDVTYRTAADKMLDYLMNKAPRTDGLLHHIKSKPEIWIDSMYMAPPFLAAAGEYMEAVRQIRGWKKYLWNHEDHLFSHIYDIGQKKFIRQAYWGVGNGWAAAGIARVIDLLPAGFKQEKAELTDTVRELIESCLNYMTPGGYYHNVIDDPASFVETNLSQMLAYTIFRGVSGGWLDEHHLPKAVLMKQAAEKKVDNMGLVQDVCGAPFFNNPGTAPEGQAFFILMQAAADKAGISDTSIT
ncbi:MAG TPA: glycoside hydrolase family 88 protein [Bacteroidales bacterium]|nr:glycoside hydrolase family 88 protein [Bacteroidales bacterium]